MLIQENVNHSHSIKGGLSPLSFALDCLITQGEVDFLQQHKGQRKPFVNRGHTHTHSCKRWKRSSEQQDCTGLAYGGDVQSESERLICLPSPHLRVQSLKKIWCKRIFFFSQRGEEDRKSVCGRSQRHDRRRSHLLYLLMSNNNT